jgi:ribosomal protein S18 acetylase RimI-like enzyme
MAITVRKASEADLESVAVALLEGSRAGKKIGLFDLVFKPADDKELLGHLKKLALAPTKCYCHLSNFFVAVSDGKEAGLICGYEPRIATHEIFSKALEEIGFDESYHERIAAYLLCEGDVDNKTFVLDFLHVKPEFKNIDVYKELIGKSMLTARLKGYRKVQTSLEIGAVETEMVFKKMGFSFVDEKRSGYYKEQFGRPGIMRLQIAL